jgi:hypothetical protein
MQLRTQLTACVGAFDSLDHAWAAAAAPSPCTTPKPKKAPCGEFAQKAAMFMLNRFPPRCVRYVTQLTVMS